MRERTAPNPERTEPLAHVRRARARAQGQESQSTDDSLVIFDN